MQDCPSVYRTDWESTRMMNWICKTAHIELAIGCQIFAHFSSVVDQTKVREIIASWDRTQFYVSFYAFFCERVKCFLHKKLT
jgi:hypothetical protein